MTSENELREWFERGVRRKAAYMVVCDTFNVGNFPVYVDHFSAVRAVVNRYNDTPMTKVVEVYDLQASIEEQIRERVTWRMPPVINVQLPAVFQARRIQERRVMQMSVPFERRVRQERRC